MLPELPKPFPRRVAVRQQFVNPPRLRACEASGRVDQGQSQIQILSRLPGGGIYASPLPPPRLRLGSLLERFPGLMRLKSDLKPILLFDRF